jgi:hypothetical protein
MLPVFGIFGTAVFAEPTISEVKKMVGLIHGSGGSANDPSALHNSLS